MRLISTIILALPMLIGGFVQFVISQFYQKFATDALLLDSAIVGGIFFVSRVSDAILDPVCGYLSDRFRARRIFIAVGILALAAGMFIAFLPSVIPYGGNDRLLHYVLAAVGIFVIYLGVTLVYIPHYAWLAALQRQNTKLPFFASRAVTENFGTICGGLALTLLVPYQQSGGTPLLFMITGMTLLLALTGGIPLIGYRDVSIRTAETPSFLRALKMLGQNRRFALVAGMSFCNQFAATTLLAVSLYYADYVLNNKDLGVTLAIVFLLSATAFVPLWSALGRRFDRYRLWNISLVAIICIFPTLLITQVGHLWYLSVFAAFVGAAAGAMILFVPQEVSYLTDMGRSEEGLYFAAFTFVNKSAMACAPLIIGLALSSAGYSPLLRTPRVANTITFLFVGLPALAFIISAILLRIYTSRVPPIKGDSRE